MQRTAAGLSAGAKTLETRASEAELIDRARGRDEAALREIMQANNRRLYRLARGILRNDSEAEDVVQETYVRAFTHLDGFRGESGLSTWLSRIAINEALGRVRSVKPHVELDSVPEAALEAQIIKFPVSPAGDPERTMAQREIQRVVERAIDELPDVFRMVFVARVMEGMNIEETADLLGVKPETVKTRLHRARTMLRENVEGDRSGDDGRVPVCRLALRAPDGGRAQAARNRRLKIFGNVCAKRPSNSCEATPEKPSGSTGVSNHVHPLERGGRRGHSVVQSRAAARRALPTSPPIRRSPTSPTPQA